MEIYIVRHGDAIDRNTPGITSDEMRWLTDLGREEIALAARVLARLGVRPDLVVSSPLVRARQTGEIFIEELGVERGLLMTEELAPGGSHAGLMHVLGREGGPERVVLCGHMPGVGSLASWLAWGRPELVRRPARQRGRGPALAAAAEDHAEASRSLMTVSETEPDPTAANQRTLWLLIAAIFVVSVDSRVITPILPAIADDLDVSISRAGLIVTAYLLPYGLFQLAYGPLADRVGQTRVVSLALGGFAIGAALCAISPGLSELVGARLLTGIAAAAVFPLTLAYIGDTVAYARRQHAIGYTVMASSIGQVMSAAIGGLLAALLSWRAIFALDGAIALVLTALLLRDVRSTIRVSRQRRSLRASYAEVFRDRRHILFYALIIIEGTFTIGAFSYYGALLRDRDGYSYALIGTLVSISGVMSVITGRMLGRIARRAGERRMILFGGLATAASYALCAIQPAIVFFTIAMVLVGTGFITMHSTFQTRATEIAPGARATGISLFAFSLFLGSSIGALLVAQAIESFGYNETMVALGCITGVFAAVAALAVIPWTRPSPTIDGR
jgi:phosphohistidine phosphatase SixA